MAKYPIYQMISAIILKRVLINILLFSNIYCMCQDVNNSTLVAFMMKNVNNNDFEYSGVNGQIRIGFLFKKDVKHALIFEKYDSDLVLFKVFIIRKDRIENILADTIEDGISGNYQFININQDSFPDLAIWRSSNRLWTYLYVYNPMDNNFERLDELPRLREYTALEFNNTNYIFSYHSNGCADGIWESTLSKVTNSKEECMGRLIGNICDDNNYVRIYNSCTVNSDLFEEFQSFQFDSKYGINKDSFQNYWVEYLKKR